MTLGQKLRRARLDAGLTQAQLVGDVITRNMLSKIENDSATPSMRTLEQLALRLNLPASYFLSDFTLSDGTSPDGLDKMRLAYREGRYEDCIRLLEESKTCGSTDEGYLLHALACIGAAREALGRGDTEAARQYADGADYYNKQTMYYSAAVDAEMSLILAECALLLAPEEFGENAAEYERAVQSLLFSPRYTLDRAEYLAATGRPDEAEALLEAAGTPEALQWRRQYVQGRIALLRGRPEEAKALLLEAEQGAKGTAYEKPVYSALEACCLATEDYKGAYQYASLQLRKE